MMRITMLVLFLVIAQSMNAQSGLIIQGSSPNLHLVHTVVAKENWYSVGRIYNVSPKELAPYNKTTIDKPLAIGQLLKIPLTASNFSQNNTKPGADESYFPLYHIVQEKEGMYRVSVTYNKVSSDNLKKWNGLTTDQLKNGMKLVVGYLKVKGNESPFASGGSNKISVGNAGNDVAQVEKKPAPVNQPTTQPATQPATSPVKENPVKEAPVKESPKETGKEQAKEEPMPAKEEPVTKPEVFNPGAAPANHKGGFFKKGYSESGKSATGNAGTFKSTSGWGDGKYYALMNNVPIGTIVKISFSSTNKSVYAKVLGQLPEMRESTGLAVRLSDAAASELGVTMSKFYVDVNY